eukprot:TRINITY_DN4156_c0_g1_i5.p2 TRINITY_DN4156_c0_g1~~TRINITY_DN4156_c0_g1_i5.p2  ORF type:complete len:105 (-),score=38.96 TRINITY_DN4156_c0_g1_i5:197-511(-)
MDIASLIIWFTVLACLAGLLYALYLHSRVSETKSAQGRSESAKKLELSGAGGLALDEEEYAKLLQAGDVIASSAMTYLTEEYSILGCFALLFGVLIYVFSFISC